MELTLADISVKARRLFKIFYNPIYAKLALIVSDLNKSDRISGMFEYVRKRFEVLAFRTRVLVYLKFDIATHLFCVDWRDGISGSAIHHD